MPKALSQFREATARSRGTWWLIAAVAAGGFLCLTGLPAGSLVLHDRLEMNLAAPWTLLTTAFVATSPLQLAVNLAMLAIAGIWFEMWSSARDTIALFLAAVVVGSTAFAIVGAAAHSPANASITLTGCSAGIMAFLAASLWRWQKIAFAALLALEVSGLAGPNPGGSLSHLMGIISGLIYCMMYSRKEEIPAPSSDIIEKAFRSGFASLSDKERSALRDYSPRHKQ